MKATPRRISHTFVEYFSEASKDPKLRLMVPNLADSLFLKLKHDEDATDEEILEEMFAACNNGSGREHPQFLNTKIASLSVGDLVVLGAGEQKRQYRCAGCGWTKVED